MSVELGLKENGYRSVVFNGEAHPVNWPAVMPDPSGNFTRHGFGFVGKLEKQAFGFILEISSNAASNICKVTKDIIMQQIAVKGQGWLLAISPEGEVIEHEVGKHLNENPLFTAKRDWVYVWIAGQEGLEVLDVTEPILQAELETIVTKLDEGIPPLFWERYSALRLPMQV